MIYLKIIMEQIQDNLIGAGVATLGILATISMFLPKNNKFRKFIRWITKRK